MQSFVSGYFGKLPLAADFLSRHAGDDEALAFERWLQDGVRATWERFSFLGKASQRELPSVRFVFWTKQPARFLVGVLSQGKDRSGRRFPFAAFVQNRTLDLEASASAFPLAFGDFFSAMEGLARREILTPPDLYAAVEEAREQIPPLLPPILSAETFLQGRTAADLEGDTAGAAAEGATGGEAGGAAGGAAGGGIGAGQIRRVLEELRALARGGAFAAGSAPLGVRLPMPDDPGRARLAAVFWMEAIRRARRQAPMPPVCFWTAGRIDAAQAGFLDAYPGSPEALAYIHLLDPGFASDGLVRLAAAPGTVTGSAPPPFPPLPRSVSPECPLIDALNLIDEAAR
jgi:type VI secretion system ImpM family protein